MKIHMLSFAILLFLLIPLAQAASYGSGKYGMSLYGIGKQETPSGDDGDGGGGGGSSYGGTTVTPECSSDSDCGEGQYCSDGECYDAECFEDWECDTKMGEVCFGYKCVKLFDIEILNFESPVELGTFFNFTYFMKGVANISGDVKVHFWIERNGEIISSGQDVFYMGVFEEKTKTKKLFLPCNVESGSYLFNIEVIYLDYTTRAHRTIEIIMDEENETASIIPVTEPCPGLVERCFFFILTGIVVFSVCMLVYFKRKAVKRKFAGLKPWGKKGKSGRKKKHKRKK